MYSPHTWAIRWQNHLTKSRLQKKLRKKLLNWEKHLLMIQPHLISKYFNHILHVFYLIYINDSIVVTGNA